MPSDTISPIINQDLSYMEPPQATDCKGECLGLAPPEGHLYLSSNNSDKPTLKESVLSPYHKKQAHVVVDNVTRLINSVGISRIAFITLTFKENLTNNKEASRRFNNLNRRFISDMFGPWALQKEEQKRGAWHYHIVIDCLGDVRTGFDYDSWSMAQRARKQAKKLGRPFSSIRKIVIPLEAKAFAKSMPRLRIIKDRMNKKVGNYGFGRCEVVPLKSKAEFVALYMGKYISKDLGQRSERAKGVRLSSYSMGFARSCTKFQWFTESSAKWRENVAYLAKTIGCSDLNEINSKLGCKWAFNFKDLIFDIQEYSKQTILKFIKDNTPQFGFRDRYGGHLQVCSETGLLFDQVTGEILY